MPTPIIAPDCDWRRQIGALALRIFCSPLDLRNLRNRVLRFFAIMTQSCRLWLDCKFNAILKQFIRIASGLQPLAINRPRIAPNRNQTGTHPNWTGPNLTQNSRTAILTAIFTIESNCDDILQSRGLWWNCRFQATQPQRPTDYNQPSRLAFFCKPSQIAAQSTQKQLQSTQ